jgi:hypothetical protein
VINFDDLKTTFDQRQQERERNFVAATERARRMLADFPAELLPSMGYVTAESCIFVEWYVSKEKIGLMGTFFDDKVVLSACLRDYPDPKEPTTSAELLAEVKAAMAYIEPCETCGWCGQPWPQSE